MPGAGTGGDSFNINVPSCVAHHCAVIQLFHSDKFLNVCRRKLEEFGLLNL